MSNLLGRSAPLNYLEGHGLNAYPVVALTWGVLIISVAVILVIFILLVGALWRRGTSPKPPGEKLEVFHPRGGLQWVWIGTGISTAVLLASCVWTMMVLARISAPPDKPQYTIRIAGHQWWWEARYENPDPARNFTTANEIHIPTGVPVRFRLTTADVIHSFWIPQLAGKMDTIPGQTNEIWLEAKKAGIYQGQCTEYCGPQHAHMKMLLIAQPDSQFRAWWSHQLQLVARPPNPQARNGQSAFLVHCGSCHAVRGTTAQGVFGPDLSHLMTRQTIAAGELPNNSAYLLGWISDPQGKKPGSLMPRPDVTGPELQNIRNYLQTLN